MKVVASLLICMSAAAAEDYTISGIVVDHLSHQPLNHVLVEITQGEKGDAQASVLTEVDGKFTFLHVPTGKYRLRGQKRGQLPQAFGAREAGFGTAIVVDGSAKTDGIVFPLRSDSSISGVVSNEDGEPVRSAQVILFRDGVINGEKKTVRAGSANTNSSGQFHFPHIQKGKYYIAVSARVWFSVPGAETVYPITFYGDTTDASAASSIVMKEGDRTDASIVVHSAPGIRVKVPTNLRHSVRLAVPGPGGTQVIVASAMTADLPIGYRAGAMRDQVPADFLAKARPIPHQAGSVEREISNIAAGRYLVMTNGEDGDQGGMTQTVELANGGTLTLADSEAGATVGGQMTFDTPRPAGELKVRLNGGRHSFPTAVASDGTFSFGKISPGSYNVFQNSNGLRITSVEAKGARIVGDRLEVMPGAPVELRIHAQSTDTLATVKGIAISNDKGVAGAMVLLLPQDLSRVRMIRRGQSDADGSFSLLNVQPGNYTLVAIDDGEELAFRDEKVIKPFIAGGVAITAPLKSGEPVQVQVQTSNK